MFYSAEDIDFPFYPAKSFLGAASVFPCLPKDSNLITRRAVVAQPEEDWAEKQKLRTEHGALVLGGGLQSNADVPLSKVELSCMFLTSVLA